MKTLLTTATLVAVFWTAPARGTCVPIGFGLGCVPPDKPTAKCELKFATETVKLLTHVIDCHVEWATRPNVTDEEGCEQAAKDA